MGLFDLLFGTRRRVLVHRVDSLEEGTKVLLDEVHNGSLSAYKAIEIRYSDRLPNGALGDYKVRLRRL